MRVSIGGIKPGYMCIDSHDPQADTIADMWATGLPDECCVWVELQHSLEHCPAPRVMDTLKECLRILQPGGSLLVIVPDIPKVMGMWLEAPCFPPHAAIYGSQTRAGMFHCTAFTPKTLAKCFRDAGFVHVCGVIKDAEWFYVGQFYRPGIVCTGEKP